MKNIKVAAVLALSLLLAACSNSEQQPVSEPSGTPSTEVQISAAPPGDNSSIDDTGAAFTLEELIPDQWEMLTGHELKTAHADLNGDGIDDIALVLEQATAADDEAPKRALLLALGAGDDRYLKPELNESIVYRADEGGVFGDPFASVGMKDNAFVIEHYGGSNWRWSNSYRIAWQADGWYAIGYTMSSELIGSSYYEERSFDARTGEIIIYTTDEDGVEQQQIRQIEPGQLVAFAQLTPESFSYVGSDSSTYESVSLGFSISFPDSWAGYYSVTEDEEAVHVSFIGESQISRTPLFDETAGMYLFSIGPEQHVIDLADLIDNPAEVGHANGETYYYYTSTDCSVCLLKDRDGLAEDDAELALREADYARYELMLEDLPQIKDSFIEQ